MTMIFERHEVPIAYSMIAAAKRVSPRKNDHHPFEKFFFLWSAFNNIYTTIAFREGRSIQIKTSDEGTIITFTNGNVRIPKVKLVSEREQIELALQEFDEDLKHKLITHKSTKFFVNRYPSWQGTNLEYDAIGQRVNGVINVNYTSNIDYPVWSPIDYEVYEEYLKNPGNGAHRSFLTQQIVFLLYTVRNNLMHGGKRFDDANDVTVVENALPLLEMILASFTK